MCRCVLCFYVQRNCQKEKLGHLSSHALQIFTHINSFMLPQTQVIPENLSKYRSRRYSEFTGQISFFFNNRNVIGTLTFIWREHPLTPPQTTPHSVLLITWVWVAVCIFSALRPNLYRNWFIKVGVFQLVAIKDGSILGLISIGLGLHNYHRSRVSSNIQLWQLERGICLIGSKVILCHNAKTNITLDMRNAY